VANALAAEEAAEAVIGIDCPIKTSQGGGAAAEDEEEGEEEDNAELLED
jgi:hypothetical protein